MNISVESTHLPRQSNCGTRSTREILGIRTGDQMSTPDKLEKIMTAIVIGIVLGILFVATMLI